MDDYISRTLAVETIKAYGQEASAAGRQTLDPIGDTAGMAYLINVMPSADVEPVRRWIPCSERLPGTNGKAVSCLVYVPSFGAVDIADYHPDVDEWTFMGLPVTVTHWMPLPEPPEEGEPSNG